MSYAFIRRSEYFNYYILHEVPPIPAANTLSAKLRAGVYSMCMVCVLENGSGYFFQIILAQFASCSNIVKIIHFTAVTFCIS